MSNSITIEEAVARMVNIGNIPTGVSLIDYLDSLATQAEDQLADAKENKLPYEHIQLLERRFNAAVARYKFAGELKLHLEWELETPGYQSILRLANKSSNINLLELDSVSEWASEHYNISRIGYEELYDSVRAIPNTPTEQAAKTIAEIGLTSVLAKNYCVTFGYLIAQLAEIKGGKYGTPDKPNVNAIAESIATLTDNDKIKRQSLESIKTRIENALAMKKLFGGG